MSFNPILPETPERTRVTTENNNSLIVSEFRLHADETEAPVTAPDSIESSVISDHKQKGSDTKRNFVHKRLRRKSAELISESDEDDPRSDHVDIRL